MGCSGKPSPAWRPDSDSEPILLLIDETNAVLDGTLISSVSGLPATNACGVVAVYKAGAPTVYNTHFFTGGAFELPVVTGTYRLALDARSGCGRLPPTLYPAECEAGQGKYLATTLYDVVVDTRRRQSRLSDLRRRGLRRLFMGSCGMMSWESRWSA